MSKNKKILLIIAALIAALILVVGGEKRLGAVPGGGENAYYATTTRSTSASATASYSACTGRCIFGSIIVNQVGTAGWVRVWDATSTATSTYVLTTTGSSSPYTTLGSPIAQVLGTSDVAGVLTYDVGVNQGIVVETSTGFDGEYTITYKNR